MRALHAFPCSRAKLPHGVSYIFPPPRPFSPACSPPPSCFFARALQSRAQRDRCCAHVVARLPHPSGNKPRRQNWAKDHNKRAQHQFFCPSCNRKSLSTKSHKTRMKYQPEVLIKSNKSLLKYLFVNFV